MILMKRILSSVVFLMLMVTSSMGFLHPPFSEKFGKIHYPVKIPPQHDNSWISQFHPSFRTSKATAWFYAHTEETRMYNGDVLSEEVLNNETNFTDSMDELDFFNESNSSMNDALIEMDNFTSTQANLESNTALLSIESSSSSSTEISSKRNFNTPSTKKSPLFSSTPLVESKSQSQSKWIVYICQSKQCVERGAGATLGAFVGLSPPDIVTVCPAILLKPKGKGPTVRCVYQGPSEIKTKTNDDESKDNRRKKEEEEEDDDYYDYDIPIGTDTDAPLHAFEINNVDSVEKVYMILTKYMKIKGINPAACNCLKWNYRGNAHLDKGEISLAIQAYDRALATNYEEQEGVILVMRATAYLQRAFNHRVKLKQEVNELTKMVPEIDKLNKLYPIMMENPILAKTILKKNVMVDSKLQATKFQQTKYHQGLYEYALLHATQDSLRATELLPNYAKTWLRAGDSLAELRKLKESAQYYERALELDPSLADTLNPIIQRLKTSQEFLDQARANGWTEDTLRVALAVTG